MQLHQSHHKALELRALYCKFEKLSQWMQLYRDGKLVSYSNLNQALHVLMDLNQTEIEIKNHLKHNKNN